MAEPEEVRVSGVERLADAEKYIQGGSWKRETRRLLERMEESMAHGSGEKRIQAGLYNPFLWRAARPLKGERGRPNTRLTLNRQLPARIPSECACGEPARESAEPAGEKTAEKGRCTQRTAVGQDKERVRRREGVTLRTRGGRHPARRYLDGSSYPWTTAAVGYHPLFPLRPMVMHRQGGQGKASLAGS